MMEEAADKRSGFMARRVGRKPLSRTAIFAACGARALV
jgi:hypothetical protein